MNYNRSMTILFAAFLLAASPARAADPKPDAPAAAGKTAPADKTTVDLVNYFLKIDLADANPKLIAPFLAVKPETLPAKLRRKAEVKQIEVAALVRLHDTKKMGFMIQPAQECNEKDFVKPLSMESSFSDDGKVTEDELKYVQDKTKCTEIDLGCRFSLLIFFQKGKDRILKFNPSDPIMAMVAEARSKAGGTTHFFNMTFNCMH